MGEATVVLEIQGERSEYTRETTYLELAKEYQSSFADDIVVCESKIRINRDNTEKDIVKYLFLLFMFFCTPYLSDGCLQIHQIHF